MTLTVTEKAQEQIRSMIKANPDPTKSAFRIAASGRRPSGYAYDFFLDDQKNRSSQDVAVQIGDLSILMDRESAGVLDGATLDMSKDTKFSSFVIIERSSQPEPKDPLSKKVQDLLDSEINPALGGHGGFAELVDIQGSCVRLRLGGGCQGCAMARMTIKQGIESRIKEAIPEITHVVDVTEHSEGFKPYYASES